MKVAIANSEKLLQEAAIDVALENRDFQLLAAIQHPKKTKSKPDNRFIEYATASSDIAHFVQTMIKKGAMSKDTLLKIKQICSSRKENPSLLQLAAGKETNLVVLKPDQVILPNGFSEIEAFLASLREQDEIYFLIQHE